MKSFFKKALPLLFLFLCTARTAPAADSRIKLLYFFSNNCPQCEQIIPLIFELSTVYHVQGIFIGKAIPGPLPFPVRKGTREEENRYGVKSMPMVVILKEEKTAQILSGLSAIRDSRFFLKAFEAGAWSVSGALGAMPTGELKVVGWMGIHDGYFRRNTKFFLTDRRNNVEVKPWLPLEAVKAPMHRTRPRLMSDVIDKPVVLRGELIKTDQSYQFLTKEEISLE